VLRPPGALVRLLAVARPYWPHLVVCLIVSLASIPLALLTPLPLRIAVDNVLGSAPLAAWMADAVPSSWSATPDALLWLAIALMLITALLMQLQSLGNALLDAYVGQRLVLAFRARLFHHGQKLSLTYHDSAGATDATYRIQYDAPAIEHVLVTGLIPLLASALTLAGMIVVTMQMDVTLALVALGVMPAIWTARRWRWCTRPYPRCASSRRSAVRTASNCASNGNQAKWRASRSSSLSYKAGTNCWSRSRSASAQWLGSTLASGTCRPVSSRSGNC
jgi:ABC-type multidrug transport system fused ATPase/permease subunit